MPHFVERELAQKVNKEDEMGFKITTVCVGLFLLLIANIVQATDVLETSCYKRDCFKHGWMTTSDIGEYWLKTSCKQGDCARYGWSSVANDGSTYDVTCLEGGCFVNGWESVQKVNGVKLLDSVKCKESSCLKKGWRVTTGYDLMGGNVTCNYSDCSRYGGTSVWRGRPSHTRCYQKNCYHRGWSLFID